MTPYTKRLERDWEKCSRNQRRKYQHRKKNERTIEEQETKRNRELRREVNRKIYIQSGQVQGELVSFSGRRRARRDSWSSVNCLAARKKKWMDMLRHTHRDNRARRQREKGSISFDNHRSNRSWDTRREPTRRSIDRCRQNQRSFDMNRSIKEYRDSCSTWQQKEMLRSHSRARGLFVGYRNQMFLAFK